MLIIKRKLINTSSAKTLLPVCKSVHKNIGRLAFDHCQITDPDPAHIGFHPVFSNDGPQTKLITSACFLLDKYQHYKLLLGATS